MHPEKPVNSSVEKATVIKYNIKLFICNGFLKSGLMYAIPVFVGITVNLNKMSH